MGILHSSSRGPLDTFPQSQPRCPDDRRQRLLHDPNFHLLKVVGCSSTSSPLNQRDSKSFTVVTPASDPAILQDVTDKGWVSLSHLWGDPSTWIDWKDTGVVSADTGDVIEVRVHPDKPDEILKLLDSNPRYLGSPDEYWWIDVFCARENTPMVIMGDIYRLSRECVVLVDGHRSKLECAIELFMKACSSMDRSLNESSQEYLAAVINKSHLSDEPGWEQVFHDLLKPKFDLFRNDALEDVLLRTDGEENSSALQRSINAVVDFIDSHWMTRVWTLQESALPHKVRTSGSSISSGHVRFEGTMYFNSLHDPLIICLKVVTTAYQIRRGSEWKEEQMMMSPRQLLEFYQCVDPVLARIYRDYQRLLEVILAIGLDQNAKDGTESDIKTIQKIYLSIFAVSQRKATYTIDYVYGVLGILNIHIPRLKDDVEVWRLFSKKLQERYVDVDVPHDVNLSNAKNMADVYGKFGFINKELMLAPVTMDSYRNSGLFGSFSISAVSSNPPVVEVDPDTYPGSEAKDT